MAGTHYVTMQDRTHAKLTHKQKTNKQKHRAEKEAAFEDQMLSHTRNKRGLLHDIFSSFPVFHRPAAQTDSWYS